MSYFVLVLTLFFEGQTSVYEYGVRGATVQFPNKAACEKVLTTEKTEVPKNLPPGAEVRSLRCVERQAGI